MATTKQTAREEITAALTANGWTRLSLNGWEAEVGGGEERWGKGRKQWFLSWTPQGALSHFSGRSNPAPKDKRGQFLALINA